MGNTTMGSNLVSNTKPQSLKILAIGNSFSADAFAWLWPLAMECGLKDVTLGNLYIGGCSLQTHWQNAKENAKHYEYYKTSDGQWTSQMEISLHDGISDECWDIITLQQSSGFSGIPASYGEENCLANLIHYIHLHKANPHVKLAWHMTWAYDQDSTHPHFVFYGHDQHQMYTDIMKAVQQVIVPRGIFDYFIPVGTAIQNVRTCSIEEPLTRDGFHLSLGLGRYIAALTWLYTLTNISLDDLTWVPSTDPPLNTYLGIIKAAVQAAHKNPFETTPLKERRNE